MSAQGLAEQVVEFWLINRHDGDEEEMSADAGGSIQELIEAVGQVIERYELDDSMGIFFLSLQVELAAAGATAFLQTGEVPE